MPRSEESEPALIVPEALIFIMLGAFLAVGGGIWFSYEIDQPFASRGVYYVCVGLVAMGVALIAIGLGIGRMALTYPDIVSDVLNGKPLQRKRICRTFSDCTTAPRNGIVSGCYPLDAYYKALPEAEKLRDIKSALENKESANRVSSSS